MNYLPIFFISYLNIPTLFGRSYSKFRGDSFGGAVKGEAMISSVKWSDVCILIGFISSLVGLFWSSIFLLPIGIICSVIGFIGNKTNGLAIAGMVISIIAFIVKIAVLLNEAGVIPEWVTRGLF